MAEKTTLNKTTVKRKTETNVIYIGNKPSMRYVLAVITEFNGGSSKKVAIKARGRTISKAVDVAEIVRNRFVKEAKLKDIKINTETITDKNGKTNKVSSIEIYLTKNQ